MSINWRQTFIRFVRIYFLADKSISRASADDVTWNLLRIGVWLITPYLAILNKTQFYNHFTLITKHYSRVQKLGLVHRNEMPFKIHDNWDLRDFKFRLARGGGAKLMLHPIFFFCWLNRMANFVNVLSAYRWKWPFFLLIPEIHQCTQVFWPNYSEMLEKTEVFEKWFQHFLL